MAIDRRTFLGAAGTAAFSACPDRAGAQNHRRTLTAMLSVEPATLNYPLLNLRQTQQVCGNINEALILFDWQLTPRPNLARSFEISPDGLTYTFHLEPEVLWHDQVPFTAKDVVFSSDVMLRQLNARSRASLSHCESIKALDAHTVEYRLKRPYNAFLLSFMASSGPMMPAHIYEGTDFRTNPYNNSPIGTGPFKFQQWQRGQYIHLVRNEHYWRRNHPFLDEIYFRFVPAAEQRMVALETGAADLAFGQDIDPVVASRLRANPSLQCVTNAYDGDGEIALMEINQRRFPFNDRRFRAALMHAIDREFMVKGINFGFGKVANGPIASTARYYDDSALTRFPFDPPHARALLDEMGLRTKANGVRAKLNMIISSDGGGAWSRCAQYGKQALSDVGFDVELQTLDLANYNLRNSNWEFDLCWNSYGTYGDPAIGVSRLFLSSNIRKGVPATNLQGYKNPEVDDLFARAAVAISATDAQRSYSRIQQILTQDVAMLWMFERKSLLFYSKKFRDVVTGPNGPCDGFGATSIA
jgi:peptide/nickel transport system substrate-binding protein